MNILPKIIIAALTIPKFNNRIPNPSAKFMLISIQATIENAIDNIKHITAIIPLSEKNILNKSEPLVPIALKIPISFILDEIEDEMKLNSIKDANTANTIPIIRNTFCIVLIISTIIETFK